jgi:hypothetical protein
MNIILLQGESIMTPQYIEQTIQTERILVDMLIYMSIVMVMKLDMGNGNIVFTDECIITLICLAFKEAPTLGSSGYKYSLLDGILDVHRHAICILQLMSRKQG